jgi:hypothetical protein
MHGKSWSSSDVLSSGETASHEHQKAESKLLQDDEESPQ